MANILNRFNKKSIGIGEDCVDYTDKISADGDFTKVVGLNVILKSWYNLLITPDRTVDHDPEYGCDLYKYVFAQTDTETQHEINDEITYKITTYDNRATIKSSSVHFLKNRKGFVINIVADYKGESKEISAVIDETTFDILGR